MANPLSALDRIKLFPLWVITLLPLRILYLISDFIFLILYYVVQYRRSVVAENLQKSYSEKSEKERNAISRKFFSYLCDYFIESLYLMNMSLKECNKRYIFHNAELLNKLAEENKNIILATSHYGNWEWAANMAKLFPYQLTGIYKPLSNRLFDRLFIYLRARYGGKPIPMKQTLRTITGALRNKELISLYFVADQRPGVEDLGFWTTFMNQETPVITGMDKLARRFNFPVVFLNIERPRRGYYEVTFDLISESPADLEQNQLAEKYIRKVEDLINKRPEFYLWSHKRWKYSPAEYKTTE